MSLSRTARRISLPALLAVVMAATLLAIAPAVAPAGVARPRQVVGTRPSR